MCNHLPPRFAVLEMQLNNLAEIEAAQPVDVGITDESFDALATATFCVPRHDIDTLQALPVASRLSSATGSA